MLPDGICFHEPVLLHFARGPACWHFSELADLLVPMEHQSLIEQKIHEETMLLVLPVFGCIHIAVHGALADLSARYPRSSLPIPSAAFRILAGLLKSFLSRVSQPLPREVLLPAVHEQDRT